MKTLLFGLSVLCLVSASGAAQEPMPVSLQRVVDAPASSDSLVQHTPSLRSASVRYGVSFIGATAGAISGLALAFNRGTQGCDGPAGFCGIGADYAAAWMTAVVIPGAALGASVPRLGVPCSYKKRLLYSAVGASIGGGLGAFTGSFRTKNARGTMLSLAFVGSTAGSTFAVHRCGV